MAVKFINPYLEKEIPKQICGFVTQAFKDPENRRAFENWYREKYGKEYVWKIAHMEYDAETGELTRVEEEVPAGW